ncbi:hypothetical protein GCM10007049_38570 [Echinicola pacifica]|uniref:Outer membrane protein beta-barrel domain-containing protein n=1 Tax=Echinicola pacifica TaxID=346377 RepID=A0A918QEA2_9BACT|nr:hypothetical protein [Echinicola pacifica]GGZ41536.1 hypothetical protein GCM10007049_38570 [Echinicola pacifica]
MKKFTTLLLVGLLCAAHNVHAQIESVYFDVVNNQINEGNPLPSEEIFYIKGIIPNGITYVEAKVYLSSKSESKAKNYSWKQPFDFEVNQYEMLVGDPLRSNDNYTIALYYYQRADTTQMQMLKGAIHHNLEAYIRANLEINKGKIKSYNTDKVMINQLNEIVNEGVANYSHFIQQDFRGFSDIVTQKLDQREEIKLKKAKFNILGRKEKEHDNERAVYAAQYVDELIALLNNETDQYLADNMFALVDIREIKRYPTEKKAVSIPLNFGYGGFAMKRSFSDTEYFNGMYAGVSLPLGNTTFTKFLGNASFSTGVFLQNFESNNGTKLSGPFVNLPIYAGLGYKLFRVFRFNAGLVGVTSENQVTFKEEFQLQPYAGFSLEFNLWLGLDKK